MKFALGTALAAILTLLPHPSFAQMTCEETLTPGATEFRDSLNDAVIKEFHLQIYADLLVKIDQQVNSENPISDADKKIFQKFLKDLGGKEPVQTREASTFLDRPLSEIEATGLRLTRALGRTERGVDPNLFGFSGNYTPGQIVRKDRMLELTGFSLEERFTLLGNKLVDDVITKFSASDIVYDQNNQTPEESSAMNDAVIKNANQESLTMTKGKRKQNIDKAEGTEIYEEVTRNPIVRLMHALKYDPKGVIGFCFGRAFVSHIEALRRGVEKESIRKVFVVGNIKAIFGHTTWNYHVATAIKASDGGWWIIDPFFGKTVKLDEWYAGMKKHDIKGNMRLYMTEASRFGPFEHTRYNKRDFLLAQYNKYFVDVLKYFRLKSLGKETKKQIWTKAIDKTLSLFHLGF